MTRPSDRPTGRCTGCDRRYEVTDRGVLRIHPRGRSGETCPICYHAHPLVIA